MIPLPSVNSEAPIAAVRRFNRFYTRQIGLLDEGMLNSPFSLTQVRVLYELAQSDHSTAAELCRILGLDAGYLSRILVRFQKAGLIERLASLEDGRRTLLHLTKKGRKAFEPLNTRSDEQVGVMLGKLPPAKRTDLIQAMRRVESILSPRTGAPDPYVLRSHRPGDMGWVVHRHGVLYFEEYGYDERFEALVAEVATTFVLNFDARRDGCWIAERDGEIVGSIFLVRKSKTVAKLRLLLVEPAARGLGIGQSLVAECICFARRAGYRKIVLWTQSELRAARHLYQQAGFKLVEEKCHDSWSRKNLVSETWELAL